MKSYITLIGTMGLALMVAGCSSQLYKSGDFAAYDDLYGIHDRSAIIEQQRLEAERQQAEAEARKAQWAARLAEIQAEAAEEGYYVSSVNPYEIIVADTYESAYARRLAGFQSPTYRLPSSYFDLRYNSAYNYLSAYDPAFYNVMVSGDQVWVEPRYITSMFGTWGATPVYNYGWYVGWGAPYYAWWGYPHYSWWDWNWNLCYASWYNPWWGYPGWGYPHFYPGVWHPVPGGVPVRPHRTPDIVKRPSPYTSPTSGQRYGTGTRFGGVTVQGNRNPSGQSQSSSSSGRFGGTTNNRYDNRTNNASSTQETNRGTNTLRNNTSRSSYNSGSSSGRSTNSGGGYNRGGGSSSGSSSRSGGRR